MSTKTLKDEKKLPKQLMFSKKCLGIVLKRTDKARNCECGEDESVGKSSGELHRCSSVASSTGDDWMYESGYLIYQEFQEENRQCFWNTILVDSVSNVEYMGYVAPGTLLVCGNEYYLEAVRSAWARRVLRAPSNFIITRLGDVTGLEIQVIAQTQFTPLPEALCLVVSELNLDKQTASLDVIVSNLQERFSDMIIPNQEVVYNSLGKLIKDRKVYHTGDGYFIVTPETYHMTTMSSLPERPLLMSNEEAIHKLHGGELVLSSRAFSPTRTRSIQTNMADSDEDMFLSPKVSKAVSSDRHLSMSKLERAGSLRLSRKEKHRSEEDGKSSFVRSESVRLSPEKSRSLIKDINLKSSPAHREVEKGEKISVFSKLFRRSSSKRRKDSKSPAKYATFSAQFPPLEWSDPDMINFHSRSTQTLSKESRNLSSSKATLNANTSTGMSSLSSMNINHNSNNNHHAAANNNIISNGNQHPNHHVCNSNNAAPASAASTNAVSNLHSSIKCKTDSLTRLRDPDKAGSSHHRARSANRLSGQATDLKSQTESSYDRSLPCSLHKKGNSGSSELNSSNKGQKSSGGQRNSCQQLIASSRSSVSHLVSPARYSKSHSSSKTSSQEISKLGSSPSRAKNPGSDGRRESCIDQDSLHSSATSLNRMDLSETKVKNTDLKTDDEYKLADLPGSSDQSMKKSTSRNSNRWSIHGGAETGLAKSPMNNASSGYHRSGTTNGKQPKLKCINKLNHSSNSSSSANQQSRSPNVTAAVRPTQAIKPLNQYVNSDTSPQDRKSFNEEDGEICKIVSSPSFTKSFDLETTEFKSITALKLLKGISVNSIDTLVEVNLVASERKQVEDKVEVSEDKKSTLKNTVMKIEALKTSV